MTDAQTVPQSPEQQAAALRKAQADARAAEIAVERAQFEFEQLKRPTEGNFIKQLKDLTPSVTPQTPKSSGELPEKSIYASAGVYETLRTTVDDLRDMIVTGVDKHRGNVQLWWYEDDLAAKLQSYLDLLNKVRILQRFFEQEPDDAGQDPDTAGFAPPALMLTGLYALQGLSAGVAMTQSLFQAFKTTSVIRSENTEIAPDVFKDLLKRHLLDSAHPVNDVFVSLSLNLNTAGPLIDNPESTLGQAVKQLLDTIHVYDQTLDKDQESESKKALLEAVRKEVSGLISDLQALGSLRLLGIEQLCEALKEKQPRVLFLKASILTSGAAVINSERAFSLGSRLRVDAHIVYTYALFRPDGRVIAGDVVPRSKTQNLKLE